MQRAHPLEILARNLDCLDCGKLMGGILAACWSQGHALLLLQAEYSWIYIYACRN